MRVFLERAISEARLRCHFQPFIEIFAQGLSTRLDEDPEIDVAQAAIQEPLRVFFGASDQFVAVASSPSLRIDSTINAHQPLSVAALNDLS
jgi:hypothetical protein